MTDPIQVPQAATDLAKEFELFRPDAYQDPGGVWTVGWGHTGGVSQGTTIGRNQADRLLQLDLEDACKSVLYLVQPPLKLNDGQLVALADFVFNLGPGALRSSTLLKKLNAGDMQGAADEFPRWDMMHVNGKLVTNRRLRERRCRERDLFLGLEPGTSWREQENADGLGRP